jgi:DNA-directed RNA polymerase specialized sigma24 family protein
MSHSIDAKHLERVMSALRARPKDNECLTAFLDLMKPVITLTLDRFPDHMRDDLAQEIRMSIMRKAESIANSYFAGRIKNPTNYFFTACKNWGINYLNKELKTVDRMMPIEDLKLEPVYEARTHKEKIVQEIREECLAFIRSHFTKRHAQLTAERFMESLLRGERPSFNTGSVERFARSQRQPAKDTFSIVLIKLRELTAQHIEDLTS